MIFHLKNILEDQSLKVYPKELVVLYSKYEDEEDLEDDFEKLDS